MILQYGPLVLNLIQIHDYKREAVYSGPNYLYTTHTLAARAWLNPGTQSDRIPGGIVPIGGVGAIPIVPPAIPNVRFVPTGAPIFSTPTGPGVRQPSPVAVPGTISDTAIRHQFMQPRQRLQLSVAGINSLVSPAPGFATDALNGPTPVHCMVEQIGPRTWVVDFVISTAVNESYFFRGIGGVPILLANQWRMYHQLDEDFFTTRVVEGRASFRTDGLLAARLQPDDWRRSLMLPIPAGFKRESVEVRQEEDGATLHYKLVDRQLPLGWSSAAVTRMRATHTVRITKAEPEQIAVQASFRGLSKALEDLSRETVEGGAVVGGNIGSVPAALGHLALGTAEAAWGMLPVAQHLVDVELWGHPAATRISLDRFARSIIAARMSGFFAAMGAALVSNGFDITVTHHLAEKHVQVQTVIITGPVATAGILAAAAIGGGDLMPLTDNTGTLITVGGGVPAPNFDGLSRGTYLEKCVASALASQDTTPPSPTAPGFAGAAIPSGI